MSDSTSAGPEGRAASGAGNARDANVALYRVAYDQSLRTLADQGDELSGMRGRAAQYLAFVGSATAFLVGTGLSASHRNAGYYTLAALASASSVITVAAVTWMLRPRNWQFRLDASVLIEKWIECDVPRPTEQDLLRALALRHDKMRESNDTQLATMHRFYVTALLAGGVGVLLWAALVWVFA